MRIDRYLVAHGKASGRERAKSMIDAGSVFINGKTAIRASQMICDTDCVEVKGSFDEEFVGRGGIKLSEALSTFKIDVNGLTVIDIGASTGGFTDCLLRRGAAKVYAIDVGNNQLHSSIASDSRVTGIDKYNARNIKYSDFGIFFDAAVMDVSFISQTLIIPSLPLILKAGATFISLIKPQFEVGRSNIGKGGIVKSATARRDAVLRVIDCATENGFDCMGIFPSPIRGGDGNIEYLAHFSYVSSPTVRPDDVYITEITSGFFKADHG